MRHIKPYNFCMKLFFLKCIFFEILRGFHTFGKPCITTKPLCENMMVHLTDFISSFIVFSIRKAYIKNHSYFVISSNYFRELFIEKKSERTRVFTTEG